MHAEAVQGVGLDFERARTFGIVEEELSFEADEAIAFPGDVGEILDSSNKALTCWQASGASQGMTMAREANPCLRAEAPIHPRFWRALSRTPDPVSSWRPGVCSLGPE